MRAKNDPTYKERKAPVEYCLISYGRYKVQVYMSVRIYPAKDSKLYN